MESKELSAFFDSFPSGHNRKKSTGLRILLFLPLFLIYFCNSSALGDDTCECKVCHGDHHFTGGEPTCNICHGYPPVSNIPGGPDGLVGFPSVTGSASAGAHALHATTQGMNYACDACHFQGMPVTPIAGNLKIQIGFKSSGGGSYDGQALIDPYSYEGTNGTSVTPGGSLICSNIYCHSNGTSVSTGVIQDGTSPSWTGTFPMKCSYASQGTMCTSCHAPNLTPDSKLYYLCSSCHDPVPPSLTKTDYPDSPHRCLGCHGYPPVYSQDQPKSNSHIPWHRSFACSTCHFDTTEDGLHISNKANHANGVYDVKVNPGAVNQGTPVSFTYTYLPGGGKCSNITCHGSPVEYQWEYWGGVQLTARIAWNPGAVCNQIDFSGSMDGTPPQTFSWDFGDGQTATGQNVSHTYTTPGNYTVSLSGVDAANHQAFTQTQITTGQTNINPVPNANIAVSGMTATVTDLSTDPDYNSCGHSGPGSILIQWGDSQTTEAPVALTDSPSNATFSHTYSQAGSYALKMAVKDNDGSGYIWLPGNIAVTVPTKFSVSGKITHSGGSGYIAGSPFISLLIYLRDKQGNTVGITTTKTDGTYSFTNINETKHYDVVPVKAGFTFSPPSQDVYTNRTDVNFVGTP